MADTTISGLPTTLDAATADATADLLVVADTSILEAKKATLGAVVQAALRDVPLIDDLDLDGHDVVTGAGLVDGRDVSADGATLDALDAAAIRDDGSISMDADLDLGGNNIVSVALVDGVDVSALASAEAAHEADAANPHSVTAAQAGAEPLAAMDVISGTTHTVTDADRGKIYRCTNAGGCTVTYGSGITAGVTVAFVQWDAGQVDIDAAGTAYVPSAFAPKTAEQYSVIVGIAGPSSGEVIVWGDLEAAP